MDEIGHDATRRTEVVRTAGFSLVELIVVMAIAGVLTVAALNSIPGLVSDRKQVAATALAVHLRHAQNMAMTRERSLRVSFSLASNRYSIVAGESNSPPVQDPVTQEANWVVDFSVQYPGVTLSAVDINGGSVLLFSRTNGVPCDGAGVPLVNTGTITFVSGRTVIVVPETGFIRVQ